MASDVLDLLHSVCIVGIILYLVHLDIRDGGK